MTPDLSGRLDLVALPTGIIDVEYDGGGRVQSITAPGDVGHTFGWDGSLPLSVATTGPVPGSVIFTYDSDLRLASRTVNGSSSVSFGYDADGLLLSAGALSLARNTESGLLETTTLANTTDSRTRTSFGELDTWTGSVSGTPVYSFDLDRDAAGRITKKTETIGGVTSVWDYSYHPQRGWLTEVRKDSVVVATYGYDDNGNRTSFDDFWGSGTSTYDDQDRQLTADLVTYDYTANGERLTKTAGADVTDYLYDVRGALLEVDLPNGIEIDYVVDASGRRIGKKFDGVLTRGWIYAGGLSPVAQTDGTGAITQSYVYATKGNVPDYLVAGGTTHRIFTDHLGSVRLVVDATTGAIAQRIDYDAWGRITLDTNPGFQPFAYAGGIYDPQTGLVRFGARDYDPEVGRWTAKDPIGFGGGDTSLYGYVLGDPINATDPSGQYWVCSADCKRTLAFNADFRSALKENLQEIPVVGPALAWATDSVLGSFMPGSSADLNANLEDGLLSLGNPVAMVSTPRRIVIGENMRRIKAIAKQIGADYWKAWKIDPWDEALAKARDARWFRRKVREGYEVVDAGIDPTRTVRSDFYQLELDLADELGVDLIPVEELLKP